MKHFQKIARYNVLPLQEQLSAHPELWNVHKFRTDIGAHMPFYGTDDIWVRFRDIEECTKPQDFGEPHFAVWYPPWRVLTAFHDIVYDLMARTSSVHLGGILITRVPAGKEVKPHIDVGWHPEFYNCKAYVAIDTNDECATYCENEKIIMRTGDAWIFQNLVTHGLINNGQTDRISAVVCMRREL